MGEAVPAGLQEAAPSPLGLLPAGPWVSVEQGWGVAGGVMAPVEPQRAGELPAPAWLPQGWPARQWWQPHGPRSDGGSPPCA